MPDGTVREIMRTAYLPDAYTDQTGLKHWGYVVYEQIILTDTPERFDVDDGYKVHKNHGFIADAADGRRFRLWSETVSYSGGLHVSLESPLPGLLGHWQAAPLSLAGYCTPQGQPVSHLSALHPPTPGATIYPLTGQTIDEHVADIMEHKASTADPGPTF